MVNVKEKVCAEMENIAKVLIELKKTKTKHKKELVVLVGIGGFLQNIYMGMENILKQLLTHKNIKIPDTQTWHKDLLKLSVENNFITKETAERIGRYLIFRHFFMHSYGFFIDEEKLNPLMNGIFDVYFDFKKEIEKYLSKVKE